MSALYMIVVSVTLAVVGMIPEGEEEGNQTIII